MRHVSAARPSQSLGVRAIRFEDVPAVLRLLHRSVEHGCRGYYDSSQRRAVYVSYAQNLFVEALGPFETVAAVEAGRLLGFAQLDPQTFRLRALFVDADFQQRGVGRVLLADVERRAGLRGATRLHGAMSLNAVPFYLHAGFRRCPGPEQLVAAGVSVPVLRMEKAL